MDAKKVATLASRSQEPETRNWLVAVSCHSEEDVRVAANAGANFVVFGPVFEKAGSSPAGLNALRSACRYDVPVLALGGVSIQNAQSCLQAGAAGLAGIRLFQDNNIAQVSRRIRAENIME